MTGPLDDVLSDLWDAINKIGYLDLDAGAKAPYADWERRVDALIGEIQAWQSAHSPEAEQAAADADVDRRIDEAQEEWR